MNAIANEPDLYRSEAFAEDVADLVAPAPLPEPMSAPVRWVLNVVPAAASLLGGAYSVLPRS